MLRFVSLLPLVDDGGKNADAALALPDVAAKLSPRMKAGHVCGARSLSRNSEDVAETVPMETTHGVEVRGQRVALVRLELLDEGLDIGRNESCAVVFFSAGLLRCCSCYPPSCFSGPYPLEAQGENRHKNNMLS
jgi:hypothetical protein